ncbi:MAG: acyltransferase [Ghiorsea sp.]|nr:acyltransferase [Ghiorsea sp.]
MLNNWLFRLRLWRHAKKQRVSLTLADASLDASLFFDLHQGASWQMGQGSYLGKDAVVMLGQDAKLSMGEQSQIGRRLLLKMVESQPEASIKLGARCRLEDDVKLITFGKANIEIADDCFIGWGSMIAAHQHISIGQGTAIAEYVSIRDHNHVGGAKAVHLSAMDMKPVTIGQHVWIGAKVTIVAGICIGDNAVIGANAVVTKDVPAGAKVAGVPARPIG